VNHGDDPAASLGGACVAPAAAASVSIERCDGSNVLVVRLQGELDLGCPETVEPVIAAALLATDELVIDLSEVTFCGSTGIGMILRANELARTEGTRLRVRNMQPNVWRVFEICAAQETLTITTT
jgi:stage II sporulation protein AA (anti-sigma F factor antagonist)